MSLRSKRSKLAKDWMLGEVSYFKQPEMQMESTSVWSDSHAPFEESDLAVHREKVKEVRHFIKEFIQQKRGVGGSILMLNGPSGAGKTACVRVLARSCGTQIELFEWMDETTSMDVFEDLETFVKSSGIYRGSLLDRTDDSTAEVLTTHRIVLIENFPTCVADNPLRFHRLLRQHRTQALSTCLLVLIISNFHFGANDSIKEKLLCPPTLCNELSVRVIEFNPVAPTLITKALTRISLSESKRLGIRAPSRQFLQRIAQECSGDLRSAINQLQFELSSGLSDNSSVEGIPKLPEHLKSWHRSPLEFDLEEVLNYCHLDGDTLIDWLHENYPDFAPHLTSLRWVMNNTSWSDAHLSGGMNWRLGLTPAADWNALGNTGFGSNQRKLLCSANHHYPALVTSRSILLANEMEDCSTLASTTMTMAEIVTPPNSRTKTFRPLRSPYTKNYWKLSTERSDLLANALLECENLICHSLGRSAIAGRNQLIMDLLPAAVKIYGHSLSANSGILESILDVCSLSKLVPTTNHKTHIKPSWKNTQNTVEDNRDSYLCPADAIAEGDALPIEEIDSDNEDPISRLPKRNGS